MLLFFSTYFSSRALLRGSEGFILAEQASADPVSTSLLDVGGANAARASSPSSGVPTCVVLQ